MGYFKLLDDKSIVKADSRLFWTLFFSMIPLLIIWGKMRVFKVLDDKSIVKADSRLFWTRIFSTIPL